MHLLVIVIFNEEINIKFTKLLFLRFFATIKILKILKLGTPWSCCTHLLHTSEESYRMYLSTWYSRTPTIYLSTFLYFLFAIIDWISMQIIWWLSKKDICYIQAKRVIECISAHGTPVLLLSIYLSVYLPFFLSFFLSFFRFCLPLSIGLVCKSFDDYQKKTFNVYFFSVVLLFNT